MGLAALDLAGKVAVVLGGTSGLGRAIAMGLAEAGADVVASSRRALVVEETATAVEALGRRTLRVPSDASITQDPAAFQRYQAAQNNVSMSLIPFRMLQEQYPDLKSNANFMALQSQLEGTENRIAISRRDYNEAVRDFNTTLRTFPQVIWAKTMYASSKPMQLFQATASAQTAPTVDFAPPGAAPGSTPPEPAPKP